MSRSTSAPARWTGYAPRRNLSWLEPGAARSDGPRSGPLLAPARARSRSRCGQSPRQPRRRSLVIGDPGSGWQGRVAAAGRRCHRGKHRVRAAVGRGLRHPEDRRRRLVLRDHEPAAAAQRRAPAAPSLPIPVRTTATPVLPAAMAMLSKSTSPDGRCGAGDGAPVQGSRPVAVSFRCAPSGAIQAPGPARAPSAATLTGRGTARSEPAGQPVGEARRRCAARRGAGSGSRRAASPAGAPGSGGRRSTRISPITDARRRDPGRWGPCPEPGPRVTDDARPAEHLDPAPERAPRRRPPDRAGRDRPWRRVERACGERRAPPCRPPVADVGGDHQDGHRPGAHDLFDRREPVHARQARRPSSRGQVRGAAVRRSPPPRCGRRRRPRCPVDARASAAGRRVSVGNPRRSARASAGTVSPRHRPTSRSTVASRACWSKIRFAM